MINIKDIQAMQGNPWILGLFGILFLVSLIKGCFSLYYILRGKKIEATVMEVSSYRINNKRRYILQVSYDLDGITYENVKVKSKLPTKKGDMVTIYVLPNHPEKVGTGHGVLNLAPAAFLLLILLALTGIIS